VYNNLNQTCYISSVCVVIMYHRTSLFALYHIGVADGVGGWRTYGVDPSQFPKSLMAACERMVHSGQFTPRRPVDVLSSGYNEIQQDKAPLIGMNCCKIQQNSPTYFCCPFTVVINSVISSSRDFLLILSLINYMLFLSLRRR